MERIKSPKYRRVCSACVYFYGNFIVGFDFNARNSQAIFYLTELKASNIPIYQGLLIATNLFIGAVFGLILGYYNDRFGKARRLVLITNLLVLAGILIYSVPISPDLLIVGQLLNGLMLGLLGAVQIAELARMFDGSVLTRALSSVNIGLALGFVIGPSMNFALVNIDIHYEWFYIHPTNDPGFIVAILFLTLEMAAFLFLYNSEEVDKYNTLEIAGEKVSLICKDDDNDNINEVIVTQNTNNHPRIESIRSNISIINKLKLLLRSKNIVLLYFCTFYWTFSLICMEAFIPLIAADWMGFDGTQLSISYIISGSVFVLANTGFAVLQQHIKDFHAIITLSVLQFIVPGVLILMYYLKQNGMSSDTLYYSWVAIGSMTWILEDVLSRSMASKFVPLEFQGFAEGIRTIPKTIGMASGGIFTSVWLESVYVTSPIIILAGVILIIGLFVRREDLLNPQRLAMPSAAGYGMIDSLCRYSPCSTDSCINYTKDYGTVH